MSSPSTKFCFPAKFVVTCVSAGCSKATPEGRRDIARNSLAVPWLGSRSESVAALLAAARRIAKGIVISFDDQLLTLVVLRLQVAGFWSDLILHTSDFFSS